MEQQTGARRKKLRLGDILVQQNVITEEKLQEALKKQRGSGKKQHVTGNNISVNIAIFKL